jgi:hypothetical protein
MESCLDVVPQVVMIRELRVPALVEVEQILPHGALVIAIQGVVLSEGYVWDPTRQNHCT